MYNKYIVETRLPLDSDNLEGLKLSDFLLSLKMFVQLQIWETYQTTEDIANNIWVLSYIIKKNEKYRRYEQPCRRDIALVNVGKFTCGRWNINFIFVFKQDEIQYLLTVSHCIHSKVLSRPNCTDIKYMKEKKFSILKF